MEQKYGRTFTLWTLDFPPLAAGQAGGALHAMAILQADQADLLMLSQVEGVGCPLPTGFLSGQSPWALHAALAYCNIAS